MEHVLDLSLGAIEVAVLLASVLYGLVLIQTYVYALSCKSDRPALKLVVALIACFETVHMISTWAYLYDLTVRHFGNPLALASLTWGLCLAIATQAAAGGLVQIFYVWRVHVFSQRWWLALPPFIGAAMRIAIGFVIAGLAYGAKELPRFQARYSFTVYIATISSAAVDLWNTTALCFFLRTRSTGHASTRNVVKRAIMWAIETGIITSSASILLVVFWSTMPGNALWLAVMIIYAKLYSNSLLVSLNARASVTRLPSSSSGRHFEGPGPSPVVITRTRNFEVSQHGSLPTNKPDYGTDTVDIPLSDFNYKQEREEHPFDTC